MRPDMTLLSRHWSCSFVFIGGHPCVWAWKDSRMQAGVKWTCSIKILTDMHHCGLQYANSILTQLKSQRHL